MLKAQTQKRPTILANPTHVVHKLPCQTQPSSETIAQVYNSWLGFLPLAVFLGRRSEREVSQAVKSRCNSRRTLVNVGQYTTLGDRDMSQELVQLLVVSDGQLEMSRDDSGLLVITSGVASKFENLGSEVLKDGCKVDGSTGADTLRIVAFPQKTMDTTNRECKACLGGSAGMEVSVVQSRSASSV